MSPAMAMALLQPATFETARIARRATSRLDQDQSPALPEIWSGALIEFRRALPVHDDRIRRVRFLPLAPALGGERVGARGYASQHGKEFLTM